jgi:hypothetical protein
MIEDGTFYTGKLLRGLLFICTLQRYNVPWSLAVFLFLSWPIVIFASGLWCAVYVLMQESRSRLVCS